MKKISFFIKSLGAIRDSEIELTPLMIFSGESGLGKSYASFLIHYLYVLLSPSKHNRFFTFFKEKEYDFKSIIENRNKQGGELFKIRKSDILDWINADAVTYIGYLLGHNSLEGEVNINIPIDDLIFHWDEDIMGLENNEEVFYKITLGSFVYRMPAAGVENLEIVFNALLVAFLRDVILEDYNSQSRTFLMPPSRGSLIELNSRPAFSSGMYEEFFDNKEDLTRPLREGAYQMPNLLSQCLSRVNAGSLLRKDGKIFYQTENGDNMPITAAASSVKELAPLTMFFQKYSPQDASILFEEPEAHLHPTKQTMVADLVSCSVGLGCHMQITTHSDYFLKRINNLMFLFRLKNENLSKFEELCSRFKINENIIIDPVKVSAYVLVKNEDETTRIVNQKIEEEGIPYTSFYDIIDADLESSYFIQNALDEERKKEK